MKHRLFLLVFTAVALLLAPLFVLAQQQAGTGCEMDIAMNGAWATEDLTDVVVRRGYTQEEMSDSEGTLQSAITNKPLLLIVNVSSGHKLNTSAFHFGDLSFNVVSQPRERRGFVATVLPTLRANATATFMVFNDGTSFGILLPPTPQYAIFADEVVRLGVSRTAFITSCPTGTTDEGGGVAPHVDFTIKATETPALLRDAVDMLSSATIPFAVTALLGVPITDAQVLVVLGSAPCAPAESYAVGVVLQSLLSPFFDNGIEFVVLSHCGIMLAFWGCHFFAAQLGAFILKVCGNREDPHGVAASYVMYPSLTFTVMNLYIGGAFFGSIFCAANMMHPTSQPSYVDDSVDNAVTFDLQATTNVRAAIGLLGLAICGLLCPYIMHYVSSSNDLVRLEFEQYTVFGITPAAVRLLLSPSGTWLPTPLIRRYGQLFNRFVPHATLWKYWHFVLLASISFVSTLDFHNSNSECADQHLALAILFPLAAILVAIFRPFRSAMVLSFFTSATYLLLSGLMLIDSLSMRSDGKDGKSLLLDKAILLCVLLSFIALKAIMEIILRALEALWWRPNLEDRSALNEQPMLAVHQEESEPSVHSTEKKEPQAPSPLLHDDTNNVDNFVNSVLAALDDSTTDSIDSTGRDNRVNTPVAGPTAPCRHVVPSNGDTSSPKKNKKTKMSRRQLVMEPDPDSLIYVKSENASHNFIVPHPSAGMYPDAETPEELQRRLSLRRDEHVGFQQSPLRNPSYNKLKDMSPLEALQWEMDSAL